VSSLIVDLDSQQAPAPPRDLASRLEPRIGALHLRQRLGIEDDHEKIYGHDVNSDRLENSKFLRSLVVAGLKLTGMYWLGSHNTQQTRVLHNQVSFARLPAAFDGLTLLHISDLHADMNTRVMRHLPGVLSKLQYDICVLTGDFRGETHGPHEESLRLMETLRPHLKGPLYGVLGNHDTIRMVPALEDMSIRMLLNESIEIARGSERIHIAGIDDGHYYRLDDFEKTISAIPPGEFSILLSHTPETYRQAAHAGFDFFLAGHTHGGQICLPGSIPITLEAKLPRELGSGAWKHHHMSGYTSVGVGTCIIPVRFNCPPEITLHHLKRA
jgi:predicted MPP superfamily phosphohydrolase